MRKIIAILLTLVLVFAMGAVTVFADNETVNITTAAELEVAITAQKPGQTWNIAAGVYDIGQNTTITEGGQTGWYFPVVGAGITIIGAGIDQTVITSSTFCKDGNWATQDMISVWGDNVTIKNLTIRPKLETNKAIEIMGMNFKAQNIAIRNNTVVSKAAYLAYEGGVAGSADDWGRFGGSVYFNPQNTGKDIGTATLDNVLISQAWISCRTDTVSAGSLNLTGGTTIDFRNSFYAGMDGYGVMSSNPNVIHAINFKVIYGDPTNVAEQITARVPAGTILIKADNTGTEVKASANVSYVVVITPSVNFGTINKTMSAQTRDFTVSVTDALIEVGSRITVAGPTAEFMYAGAGSTPNLPFTLDQPNGIFNFTGNGIQTAHVSCIPANLTAAGSYKGYMTFTVDYNPAP